MDVWQHLVFAHVCVNVHANVEVIVRVKYFGEIQSGGRQCHAPGARWRQL